MSVLGKLLGGETRGITPENGALPLTGGLLTEWMQGPFAESGVRVNEHNALRFPAVWRAVSLISGTCAALPLKAYRTGTRQVVNSPMVNSPHRDLTPFEFWRLSYMRRLLWGNFAAYKLRDPLGRVKELQPLDPSSMRYGRTSKGDKVYHYTDSAGEQFVFTDVEILHIPGLSFDGVVGIAPVRMAMQTIGLGIAAEDYAAKLFGSGNLNAGVLQAAQQLTAEQADQLQQQWARRVGSGLLNAHKVPVLDAGVTFNPVTMPNDQAQFLESRKFEVVEIARWFGIPPHLLGDVERSTSWGTGIEQQSIGLVKYTLAPDWLVPTEQRVSQDLTGTGTYVKYNIDALMRGDSVARAEFYNVMRNIGAYSVNDIRDLEDMDPVDGGDTYLQALNMAPLGSETNVNTPPDGKG